MCVHHDASKHVCYHLGAVNKTWIGVRKSRLAIFVPRFVIDHAIQDTPLCDAASRVVAALVSKLRVHAAANVIEIFMQTLIVSQITPISDSGLVTSLHDPLRP
ncbi:hypothetical protein TNCV_4814081 [Trichonephila clavipes]|nr:hypothetical protein TNCV_4814081 [Trichonephila clavipes]